MRLQGKSILVLPDDAPRETKGGIINPLSLKKPITGKVIDCGPGCESVRPGNQVQYKTKGASIIMIDGVAHHFIIEEQIFFVYG